jgi:hypothetical protein
MMMSATTTQELQEARRAAIAAMVKEIGSSPMQDMHFDAWYYPDQSPQVVGLQPYEHSVLRKYVSLSGAGVDSALVQMANYLMLVP